MKQLNRGGRLASAALAASLALTSVPAAALAADGSVAGDGTTKGDLKELAGATRDGAALIREHIAAADTLDKAKDAVDEAAGYAAETKAALEVDGAPYLAAKAAQDAADARAAQAKADAYEAASGKLEAMISDAEAAAC